MPAARRGTPRPISTLQHSIKVNKNNEHQVLSFNATFTNLLNQHSVTSYWEGSTRITPFTPLYPAVSDFQRGGVLPATETGYNPQTVSQFPERRPASSVVLNSHYGTPNLWQLSRNIRLGAHSPSNLAAPSSQGSRYSGSLFYCGTGKKSAPRRSVGLFSLQLQLAVYFPKITC